MIKIIISYTLYVLLCSLPSYTFANHDELKNQLHQEKGHTACNTNDIEKYLETTELELLTITTSNTRKWLKNYLRIIKDKGDNIPLKYKKNFNSNIIAQFSNGLRCEFKAKIRVSGDWKDHTENAPPPITSLDVKLLNGNIDSVVKFKLFLPHTRNNDNELFVSLLLKELGFISPKTYYVPSIFNGIKYRFIFQEKSTKELIESFQLREAPILEGDERFVWSDSERMDFDDKYGLARIVNKNWVSKGTTSLNIAIEALSILNNAYLKYLNDKYIANINNPDRLLNTSILSNNNAFAQKNLRKYSALLIALRAEHALRPHNRVFYYNATDKYFVPIYYDSDSDILNPENNDLKLEFGPLNNDEIKGAEYALEALQTINKKRLIKNLRKSGLDININRLNQIINSIKLDLISISNTPLNDQNENFHTSYFSNYNDSMILLVFSGENTSEIIICTVHLQNCIAKKINLEDYSRLLNGRQISSDGKSLIFVSSSLSKYKIIRKTNAKKKGDTKVPLNSNTTITLFGNIHTDVNHNNKSVHIKQQGANGRALISGGNLSNWKINFSGYDETTIPSPQRFNVNLITGCLTLSDIELDKISINIDSAQCEDAVNLIRTKGTIGTIQVTNSSYDAVDIDFSSIDIKNAKIINSGNDCIDLSSGRYSMSNIYLSNCGDKGISIGEASTAYINNTTVTKANTGIAVKDSSRSNINNIKLAETPVCISASNKKQEYWGAKAIISGIECTDGKILEQNSSLIKILK